jgi:HK97 family phage major capsid protein
MAELISINAAGAMASGAEGDVMPIIGGAIETLEFIPDGVIIGGYGDVYLMAERQGSTIAKSEHVRFTDDQTVFRGVARYDGMPVIPEAFVAMHIAGGTVSASAVTFAEDKANVGA